VTAETTRENWQNTNVDTAIQTPSPGTLGTPGTPGAPGNPGVTARAGRAGKITMRLFSATATMFFTSLVVGMILLSLVQSRFDSSIKRVSGWSGHLQEIDKLGPRLQSIATPANKVFESQQKSNSADRLNSAYDAFRVQLKVANDSIEKDPAIETESKRRLLGILRSMGLQAQRVQELGLNTIEAESLGKTELAAGSALQLTLTTTEATQTINRAKVEIYRVQDAYLANQERSSERAKSLGVGLSVLGALAVLVVWGFGRRLARIQRQQSTERLAQYLTLQRSEAELRAYNRKLSESNRDLTDFAYVASHDLQEPLRKIMAFGDRLKTKYGDELGEVGSDYLARMQNAAGRMQTLIEDLLTFSRVTTRGEPFVETDMNGVVRGVVSDLEVAIERAGATVEIGEFPTIQVDPSQMRQLTQNLIGNALKFRRPDTVTFISVKATRLSEEAAAPHDLAHHCPDGWWQIDIKDNGIGFEQKYADKIFTVFQRLHGRGEYEGSGVGLAVVRRIIERHQGEIWVTSTPNVGTTFHIVVPASQPKSVLDDLDESDDESFGQTSQVHVTTPELVTVS
jgi:signal transduction histidine kinase